MKVFIKQYDFSNQSAKVVGSFTITADEFIGFFTTKTGSKILKSMIPPDSPAQKLPSHQLIHFIQTLYALSSTTDNKEYVKDFYIFEPDCFTKKNPAITFLSKYFPHQMSINFKPK